ncbi:MAG TPA: hypothetical protein VJX66_29215 [Amycolatopsis sp.]|nr:hypothetical protein [Amycolatopsis sp.]
MTYPTYGDDPEYAAEFEDPADRARRDIDELFEAVEGIRTALKDGEALREEVGELSDAVDRVTNRYATRLDLAGRRIERLQQQLQALERAVRVSDGVQVVDLDGVDAETRALAAEAGRWDELERQLVPKRDRARFEQELEQHVQLKETQVACEGDLLAAIRKLASGARATDMQAELEALNRRWRTLADEEVPAAAERADAARRALDEADAIEARIVPQLERAERAWHDLHGRLRARITDAIGSSALMPTWFAHAFGVAPLSGSAGDEWIRAAASVLAYRVSYRVDDQALALGEAPGPDADPASRRWSWRAKLESRIEGLGLAEL